MSKVSIYIFPNTCKTRYDERIQPSFILCPVLNYNLLVALYILVPFSLIQYIPLNCILTQCPEMSIVLLFAEAYIADGANGPAYICEIDTKTICQNANFC